MVIYTVPDMVGESYIEFLAVRSMVTQTCEDSVHDTTTGRDIGGLSDIIGISAILVGYLITTKLTQCKNLFTVSTEQHRSSFWSKCYYKDGVCLSQHQSSQFQLCGGISVRTIAPSCCLVEHLIAT